MNSSVHFAPSRSGWNQPFTGFTETLAYLLPNILLSLLVSIIGSILLSIFAYGLSALLGFPIMPFFLIVI
jgi:hypothetical protein